MKTTALIKGAALLTALFLTGCDSEKPVDSSEDEIIQSESTENEYSVTLSPNMAQRIKIGKPKLVKIVDTLKVPSHIEVNQHELARIGASVTGRIVDVPAMVGDDVKVGTTLAHISSPELTQAQLAYLRAYSQATLAQRAAERAHQLLAADVIGRAELQRRESELQVFRAELSAATDHLRMLGVGKKGVNELAKRGQILPSVSITASRDGTVIERNVAVGQVVKPADQLFLIADLATVWVIGGVPEQDVSKVSEGQQVEIQIPALNNTKITGQIIFVADTVSPEQRIVTVRTQVSNSERKLKPAMLAIMHITDAPKIHLVVPTGAVVRENNRDHVFVAQDNNQFILTPVQLGDTINGVRPILKGLDKDQSIIIDGAFHINNQRKRAGLD
ncbi:membrane fusion protein, cobalt-zinc-cadmium efflux system [Nitrosomonas cryotolerans]|uniref:Membrane fusion protein, cobalt-zinc-cadmium efflux system n=1 Tax=Nitrosomonas cryotolerans ATCC 49181 TaxID=1131553 RepID=A0A1N6HCD3_9PROT|nr:efflux RND transporter periplasmic adaptor subunit [Nitrosomonas cryotolerans]SFP73777.1 membrane fusion protein, cobalt-zinc-cadmium efflux system [Nitrosomonas cryotolerans]SIO17430.1 membrane fusion protein, cobalt-zinc-cadmium efflux system [Nitrosomonas cryotolerans ATCC 49181]